MKHQTVFLVGLCMWILTCAGTGVAAGAPALLLENDAAVHAAGLERTHISTRHHRIALPRLASPMPEPAGQTVSELHRVEEGARAWSGHAYLLGIDTADNKYVYSDISEGYYYVASKYSANQIAVFQTTNGETWNWVLLTAPEESILDLALDVADGYVFVAYITGSGLKPVITRMDTPHDLTSFDTGWWWPTYDTVIFTSVGASSADRVSIGMVRDSEIHFMSTFSYPASWGYYDGYNPQGLSQTWPDMESVYYDGTTSYLYTTFDYFDPSESRNFDYMISYEHTATGITAVYSEIIQWSSTADHGNPRISGSSPNFSIVYNYSNSTDAGNVYLRTYTSYGANRQSLGHAAQSADWEKHAQVYHCPSNDVKFLIYTNIDDEFSVYHSRNNNDGTWYVTEEKIPDSRTSDYPNQSCIGWWINDDDPNRDISCWVNPLGTHANVFYSLNPPTSEECPGEEISLAGVTPGSGFTVQISNNTEFMADNYDESAEIPCWEGSDTREQVYRFTPPVDLGLRITIAEAEFNTKMAITSPCVTGTDYCEYNDDYNGNNAGFPCTTYEAGTTYFIIVTGIYTGSDGEYVLMVEECDPAGPSPTPVPTRTPTPPPTPTPASGTPTPSPTPPACDTLGCQVDMPLEDYGPGDICYCNVFVCNPTVDTYYETPVFAILDVYGSYFFAPDFSPFNHYTYDVVPGAFTVTVLPAFPWPDGAGSASGIRFYAAMTDTDITGLVGELGSFTFGWHE